MSSDYFESALTSLLKPQQPDRLYKILKVVRDNVAWPSHKEKIETLYKWGCLKPLIACLQQTQVNILNITLSILGNCCMDRTCARDLVKQYNLLGLVNHILKRRKHDNIQGRIFRIIGNICQHWERLANTLIEREPHLQIIPKIMAYIRTAAEEDTLRSQYSMETADNNQCQPSEATLIMAVRALRELANAHTTPIMVNLGVLKVIGQLLIKLTPIWKDTKDYEDTLQVSIRLLQVYSKYRCPNMVTELQTTDSGNALNTLDSLICISPYRVVKIVINLQKVINSRSALPIGNISNTLANRLENPASFSTGREDLLHREYLKCLCFFIQYTGMRENLDNANIIPILLKILKDCTGQTDISQRNCILILSTLRAYNHDDNSLCILLKNDIISILSEKLNWVLGPSLQIDISHEYKTRKFNTPISRKRKRCDSNSCVKHDKTLEALGNLSCDSARISNDILIDHRSTRSTSPCSDISLSSGPSFSPTSSPPISEGDESLSDSDDYSPVCSDTEPDVRMPSASMEEVMDGFEHSGSTPDDEMDEHVNLDDTNNSIKNVTNFKKQLSYDIIKLIKIFTTIRPVPMELIGSSNILNKLLIFCLPWNKEVCPPDVFNVIRLIVETPECLLRLMQTDFIYVIYQFKSPQHVEDCITCKNLEIVGCEILSKFSIVVENGCGKGDIAHQLNRGSLPVKQKLVPNIPLIIENVYLLKNLMINCKGLEILMELFQEHSEVQRKCIIAMSSVATKLKIKNPTTCYDHKSSKVILLPVNAQHYELEKNCSTVVCFKLDDGSCVQADREFLSKKSEYFNRLLSGEFKESWEDEVRLQNVSVEALKLVLLLLQYDLKSSDIPKIDADLNVLLDVIALTDRYLMEDLNICLTTSAQIFKLLPTSIPTIYQWSVESGTDILRVECVAYALVAKMNDPERFKMFQSLLQLGYSELLADDVRNMLARSFNTL